MTFEELLKANGLDDAAVAKVVAGMRDGKMYLASEENLDVRYSKLKGEHETLSTQNAEAQKLIEQLKKDGAMGAKAQEKISAYETQIADLQKQLETARVETALQNALRDAKAKTDDIDYLVFRLRQGNTDISLGEDGKIKGIDEMVTTLKTAHPAHFESGQQKKIEENRLPEGDPNHTKQPQTLAEALQAAYESDN